jgi:hypothetical protein
MPSKREKYKEVEFFPQWPNFSPELARKVCQELATLSVASVGLALRMTKARLLPTHWRSEGFY